MYAYFSRRHDLVRDYCLASHTPNELMYTSASTGRDDKEPASRYIHSFGVVGMDGGCYPGDAAARRSAFSGAAQRWDAGGGGAPQGQAMPHSSVKKVKNS